MRYLFLLLFLTIWFGSRASVVHTLLQPNITTQVGPIQGQSPNFSFVDTLVKIDFNQDGTPEYNFRWDYFGPAAADWYVHCTFYNKPGNRLACSNPQGSQRMLEPLTSGTLVDASLGWANGFPEPQIGNKANPNFRGMGDRYIAVQFTNGADTHYGWIQVEFSNTLLFTIKGYAYETTPNTPLAAGVITGDGPTLSTLPLHFSMEGNVLRSYNFTENPVEFYLHSASGQRVMHNTASAGNQIWPCRVPEGFYVVRYSNPGAKPRVVKLWHRP